MLTVKQAFDLALQHHQAGRLAEAETLYGQILAVHPDHSDALHLLGTIARQSGRHTLAVELIRQAIHCNPNFANAHYNLGNALREQSKFDEAIAAYRRAIELQPDFADAHHNLGVACNDRGQLNQAVAAFRRALACRADSAEAYNNLGMVFAGLHQLEEAIAAFQHAVELQPNFAMAHNNLGIAFAHRGQIENAVAAYRRALELQPDFAAAHNNLGNALKERGQLDDAVAAYHCALALKPGYAEAHNNLGNALRDQGQSGEAIGAYRRALESNPNFAEVHNNLGGALRDRGQLDEAIAASRRALALKPNYAGAYNNLGTALKDRGELGAALAAFRQSLQLEPEQALVHSNLVFTLHFDPESNGKAIAVEQQRWNRQFADPLEAFIAPPANDRDPERRLRVGYISPDLRDHVVGRNLLPLLQRHDRRNFEILCYAGVMMPDKLTEAIRKEVSEWHSTLGVADDALAEAIRRNRVDILVDLSQHMGGNRLPLFARKPAPVQVSFAGYPESTGLAAIEYRISDRWLESEIEDGKWEIGWKREPHLPSLNFNPRAEHVFLLDSFWCYDPCGTEVAVNELPAQETGRITFGSLNNFCKVNDPLLRLWARVLGVAKDSRLIILSGIGSHQQRTLEFLEGEGVAAQRVEFVNLRPRKDYLELYHQLDIVLDTFPYNGHTTSLDAMWMGVPVVSLAGEQAVSRAGLSQLSNLGLRELAAFSDDEYVEIANRLAQDLPHLAELRRTLRSRMEASVLVDAPLFARNIETSYRAMWRRWCGRGPAE